MRSEFSESSIRGQTQYTNAPALIALSIEDNTSSILVCDKTVFHLKQKYPYHHKQLMQEI